MPAPITLRSIEQAARRLAGWIRPTPLLPFPALSEQLGVPVWLKSENLQEGGAFKLRGATHALLAAFERGESPPGVVTYSSGNHGQGVAIAARRLGVPAVVSMPDDAPRVKVENVRRQGAEVIIAGKTSDERRLAAEEVVRTRGYLMIPPFDHADVIAGQGTTGLEIARELPEVASVVVPCGGGGLLSGVALAVTESVPGAHVHSVEPEAAPKMRRSLALGEVSAAPPGSSIADGLRPTAPGKLPFEIAKRCVRSAVVVSDAELEEAMRLLLGSARLVVEPSGAASVAALMQRRIEPLRGPVVAVITGGNVDPALLARVAVAAPPPR